MEEAVAVAVAVAPAPAPAPEGPALLCAVAVQGGGAEAEADVVRASGPSRCGVPVLLLTAGKPEGGLHTCR